MELVLLGTGSADGWPNPFCRCAPCRSARDAGRVRTPTSVLVDGTVLLDCGPEAPRQALRAGAALDGVRLIWLGHDHPDHSDPLVLLSRGWAQDPPGPLVVAGAPAAVARWREWVPPGAGVTWCPMTDGEEVRAAGHRLLALPAAHAAPGGTALLTLVTAPDGGRVLYATDTGPLPQRAVDLLAGQAVDAVLLEATFGVRGDLAAAGDHLDLDGFARELDRLRSAGAVTPGTEVIAVHLSHHSGPEAELAARLAVVGARAGRDLERVITGGTRPARTEGHHASGHRASGHHVTGRRVTGRRVTGRRVLVLGGARSGKSRLAEAMLAGHDDTQYLATGYPPAAQDAEWRVRVDAHRARRPAGWTTSETLDLAAVLVRPGPPVLVDCLTLWLTRVLDREGAWDGSEGWQGRVDSEIDALVDAWSATQRTVVAVANEVGAGIVPATAAGRVFRDVHGRMTAAVSATADDVYLMVAGRALALPGAPPML